MDHYHPHPCTRPTLVLINIMSIAEVNSQVCSFLPQVKLGAVRYDELCTGTHNTMFSSTFSALHWIAIHNCTDMDEHTFTVILQQPCVQHIDLRNNHTFVVFRRVPRCLAKTLVPSSYTTSPLLLLKHWKK